MHGGACCTALLHGHCAPLSTRGRFWSRGTSSAPGGGKGEGDNGIVDSRSTPAPHHLTRVCVRVLACVRAFCKCLGLAFFPPRLLGPRGGVITGTRNPPLLAAARPAPCLSSPRPAPPPASVSLLLEDTDPGSDSEARSSLGPGENRDGREVERGDGDSEEAPGRDA